MKTTTKEFAERLNLDYAIASGVLRFLELKGHAKMVGVRPNLSRKGKGSKVYDIPEQVTLNLKGE